MEILEPLPSEVRAAVCRGPRRIEMVDVSLGGAEQWAGALLEVELVGICGTDVKVYSGAVDEFPYPLTLGHEVVGRIVAAEKVWLEQRDLDLGDRVAVEPVVGCGLCRYCEAGESYFCSNAYGYGLRTSFETWPHLWGGMAEMMYLAPNVSVYRLSETMSAERAVMMAGGVANGICWVQEIGLARPGEAVAILGCGPQALACSAAAADAGVNTIVMTGLEGDDDRLAMARKFGTTHTLCVTGEPDVAGAIRGLAGESLDLVVDVSGSASVTSDALRMLKPMGRLVHASMSGRVSDGLPTDLLSQKQLSILGARGSGPTSNRKAVQALATGRWPFERLITNIVSLESADELLSVFTDSREGRPLKGAVRPAS